ncbi:hypothetical protein RBH29_02630 [Herbivorax sp. ANBcel31]|uniref:hypothetical protein n=1 Tax=Herbivorax sp. ANBcel31 TaxID=3069754 RepID=UPI0027B1CD27|nr:hypothetical protein [Herbivorax sp. ANBcel31]MDQ2085333.1 hypothetical protein [Herbivorax sp. ANBcel31]
MLKKVFTMDFGAITVKEIFKLIYGIGVIFIIIEAIIGIFIANNIISMMLSSFTPSNVIIEPGLILSAFFSIIVSLVLVICWKLFCELIYLIFRSFEIYINKNNT